MLQLLLCDNKVFAHLCKSDHAEKSRSSRRLRPFSLIGLAPSHYFHNDEYSFHIASLLVKSEAWGRGSLIAGLTCFSVYVFLLYCAACGTKWRRTNETEPGYQESHHTWKERRLSVIWWRR